MKPIFIIIAWVVFVAGNVLLAEWNDEIRRHRILNKNPKQIEHFWWGLGYGLLCAVPFYISHNWWQFGSLLLLHLAVFPPAYNRFSDLPLFNLSKTSKAVTDRAMCWLGLKSTEIVNIAALLMSVAFIIFQILHL